MFINMGMGLTGFESWMYSFGNSKPKNVNKMKNNRTYMNIRSLLCNRAINEFQWNGLPDSVDERVLEWAMLLRGSCALINDAEYGFLALPFSSTDMVNIYGKPVKIKAYGANGYNKDFIPYIKGSDNGMANSVVGYDNMIGFPYVSYISEAAERMTETMRSVDVATKKLKNPYFFIGDKSKQNEFKQFMKDLEDNHDAIMLTDNMTLAEVLKVENINFDVSILNALWEQYQRYENNIKENLGVNSNENIDKDERLLVDEVNSNNAVTDMNLDLRLRMRQVFCEDINDMFGLNVSVKVRHKELTRAFEEEYGEEEEEEVQDETIQ